MPELKNLRQERFAQAYVQLGNASEAYRQAGYHENGSLDANAHRLRVNERVAARISEIHADLQRKNTMKLEEALSFLAEVVRTPADAIPAKSRLIQSCKRTTGDGWEAVEVKIPDKTVCLQILGRWCGWEKPTKLAIGADDTLHAYLLELRARPIGEDILELEDTPKSL
jgi:hypothetical protein